MVGVGLDMVTYFQSVTGLMLFQAYNEVPAGLANTKGFTGTIKTVYYVASFEVVLGIFGMEMVLKFACCVDEA